MVTGGELKGPQPVENRENTAYGTSTMHRLVT